MVTTTKKKNIQMCEAALQTASDPLVGLTIQSHYSIGSFLGAGAFGQVYTIIDRRKPNQKSWAVKVVSVATTTTAAAAAATTNTKKKKTATTNADRLHYEYLMYTQQLSHLCGTILPNLPNPPLHHQLKCFYSKIHNATNNTGTYVCVCVFRFCGTHVVRKRAGSL